MLDLGLWRDVLARPFRDSPTSDVEIWRPFTALTFAANGSLNRLLGLAAVHPVGFHAANVAVHALASALVGLLALRLGLSRLPALAAGLLFAVHPVHVEAVANVVQRAEALACAFGVIFLLLHRRGSSWSCLPLFLALGSKESAVGFVALALFSDLLHAPHRPKLSRWIGPLVAVGVFFVFRAQVLEAQVGRPGGIENPVADAPTLDRLATALRVQWLYVRLLVWPVGLSSDYSFEEIPVVRTFLDPRVLAFLALLALACFMAWRLRRDRPVILYAVAAYVGLFAVTSNVLMPIGTIAAERLLYAPSIAAVLIFAEGLSRALERGWGRIAWIFVVAALLCSSILTVQRNAVWRDEVTFFTDQVATAPASAKAHMNLGIVLQRAGDDAGAVPRLERSLAIYPENSHAWYVLGIALFNLRADPVKVITTFQNALRHGPMNHDARVKLTLVFLNLGGLPEAQRVVDELALLAPNHPMLPELRARIAAAR